MYIYIYIYIYIYRYVYITSSSARFGLHSHIVTSLSHFMPLVSCLTP